MELPTCILVDPAVACCREMHVAEDGTAIQLEMDHSRKRPLAPSALSRVLVFTVAIVAAWPICRGPTFP